MAVHFLRPYWFLAIIPICIWLWYLLRMDFSNNWRKVCDAHLLPHLIVQSSRSIKFPVSLLLIAVFFTIVSLAGPSWEKQTQPIYRAMLARTIVLNLTPSMADELGTTSKIARARFKILDLLKREREGFTGLVVYSDEAHVISPLTEDNRTIANFIPSLDPNIMPTFNDDTAVGIKEAVKLFHQASLANGNVILITDKITNDSAALNAARSLFAQGYRLYILNLSNRSYDQRMQALAQAGGGEVIPITANNHDIDYLVSQIKQNTLLFKAKKSNEEGEFWQDNGRTIIYFILPLALLAFRKGYL